jgi:hypothetical protein
MSQELYMEAMAKLVETERKERQLMAEAIMAERSKLYTVATRLNNTLQQVEGVFDMVHEFNEIHHRLGEIAGHRNPRRS